MGLFLIGNSIDCVCALAGFIYGGILYFHKRKALYAQMITLALGCFAVSRLFTVLLLIVNAGVVESSFQVGYLGVAGSFMFLLSANYGALDSLVDDRTRTFVRYRITALICPLIGLVVYYLLFYIADIELFWRVITAVVILITSLASYYHLKHLIIPDVDYGVVRCLRPFNVLGLIFAVSIVVEFYGLSRDNEPVFFAASCLSGVIMMLMIPVLKGGMKKWKMLRT